MNRAGAVLGMACGLAFVSSAIEAAVTEIDQCEYIGVTGKAVLTADLDCTSIPAGIGLRGNASLDFQGHVFEGGAIGCSLQNGVSNCKIVGPGTLIGNLDLSDRATVSDLTIIGGRVHGYRVTLKGVTILGPAPDGDCAVEIPQEFPPSKLKMVDSTIDGANCGIDAKCGINLKRTTVTGCAGDGVVSPQAFFGSDRVRVKDSSIIGNGGLGLYGASVRVVGSTITDNGDIGVLALGEPAVLPHLTIKNSDVSRNDLGAALTDNVGFGSKGMKIANSTLNDNARFGATLSVSISGRMRISSSTLTGNGTAPECGVAQTCADIASDEDPPKLSKVVCGSSYDFDSGFPGTNWGVCSGD